MTIAEMLVMPKEMDLLEYENLLKEKHKLEKQIRKASDTIFAEEDSLEILSDEVGSERYSKHLVSKQKAESKREKSQTKLEQIIKKLNG